MAMNASIQDGIPVNPPIWWIDPEDPVALKTDDGKKTTTILLFSLNICDV